MTSIIGLISQNFSYYLILIIPIISYIFWKFVSYKNLEKKIITLFSGVMILSLTYVIFLVITRHIVENYNLTTHIILFNWIDVYGIKVNYSIYLDRISAIMSVTIMLVSLLVHLYSAGYMMRDPDKYKFFSLLSLFSFFMLVLVLSDNFMQLFLGWEGVGVMSYLLIGFWNKKFSANIAAYKAFIINRLADCAFIVALILIIIHCQTTDFEKIWYMLPQLSDNKIHVLGISFPVISMVCTLLFIACMAKSAQIGLHVWLPDAMEGPTPVSALIHSATMVTAGVFLLIRCSFMFELSSNLLLFISLIGATTCFITGTISLFQYDIKKIIAYSTCSQLGYMILACGLSGYEAAIFHLMTHAFFKALLFLCAGNIIYIAASQDIRQMPNNLRQQMPYTYILFIVGTLSIIGLPPFSGYYSKDLILLHAFSSNMQFAPLIYTVALIGILFTSLYSVRLFLYVFHNGTNKIFNEQKELPLLMNLPLAFLGVGAAFLGWVGYKFLGITDQGYFGDNIRFVKLDISQMSSIIEIVPSIVAILGIILAFLFYYKPIYYTDNKLLDLPKHNYYFDYLYNKIFVKSFNCLSSYFKLIDTNLVDKIWSKWLISLPKVTTFLLGRIQSGYLYHYVLVSIFGLEIFLTFFIINYFTGR